MYERNCEGCGVVFMSRYATRKASCSSSCKSRVARGTTPTKACAMCGADFARTGQQGQPTNVCSDACYRAKRTKAQIASDRKSPTFKARKARIDAKRRGALVTIERFSLDEIYDRDSATCHLCGDPCPRDAATMDHIVPVSHGGVHSRANVKLAHRSCNSRKGNRV